jgi:hypothetical protein
MYLEKSKRIVIWDAGSIIVSFFGIQLMKLGASYNSNVEVKDLQLLNFLPHQGLPSITSISIIHNEWQSLAMNRMA